MASKRTVSPQTRKKISDALKKYYASGAKRGQKKAERIKASRNRNLKNLSKTGLRQQMLVINRRILTLRNTKLSARNKTRAKAIQNQINTLRSYKKNLQMRLRGIK